VLGAPGDRTRELWVACHGYGQLAAGFAKALEPLVSEERVIVVPEALSRFYLDDPARRHGPGSPVGASWMTREDREREIADQIQYLDQVTSTVQREVGAAAPSVVALGFSQGAATASRWAVFGETAIKHLIVWAGTVPPDLPSDRGDQLFRGASLVLVAGRRDEMVPPAAAEKVRAELEQRGLRARTVVFDGGHSLNSDTLRRVAAELGDT
jgi:predicted esterase